MGALGQEIFPKIRPFIKNRAVNLQNKVIQMPQRHFFIVVVLVFLFNGEILGQEKIVEKFPVSPGNFSNYIGLPVQASHNIFKNPSPKSTGHPLKPVPFNIMALSSYPGINAPVTKDFYSQHLSFFCRKELQIEKATSIPLRFRLGSLQYTDYLEQKPNAIR